MMGDYVFIVRVSTFFSNGKKNITVTSQKN